MRGFCTDIVVGEDLGTFRLGSFADDSRAGVLFGGKELSLFPDNRTIHHNRLPSAAGRTETHERLIIESLSGNRVGLRYDSIYSDDGDPMHQYAGFEVTVIPYEDGDSYMATRIIGPARQLIREDKVDRMRQLLDTGNPLPTPGSKWIYIVIAAAAVLVAAACYLFLR